MQDDTLLNVFERQGVHKVVADAPLRANFLAAARAAREKLGPTLVSDELLRHTLSWLADYRAEHSQ
jgi:hypothetical protein